MPQSKNKDEIDNMSFSDGAQLYQTAKQVEKVRRVLQRTIPRAADLRKAVKTSTPLAAVAAAADVVNLALSKDARDNASTAVEKDAEQSGPVVRAVKGFFSPVETAYGIGKMVDDLADSTSAANKAQSAAPSDSEINARYQEARKRSLQRKADDEADRKLREKVKQFNLNRADKRDKTFTEAVESYFPA